MRTVITYGRMNPPTRGHEMLVNKVQELAGDDDHHVFTSQTHDAKRNPLDPKKKHGYLKSSFPGANIQSQPSPFHALTHLQDEGYRDVTVVVGADRVSEFERIGSHKDFNFDNFDVVSAGERSGGEIENISASGARSAAQEKRYGDFKTMAPTELSGKDVRRMYGDIRTQMEEFNLTEELFSDKDELELFYEAYEPMRTLFEQDTYGAKEMEKDSASGGADLGQDDKDKKRKNVERASSRKRFESNPWPELLVVRTANDGKLRIIPKADFSAGTQEIMLGNYPDMEPKGEVTPQAALSIMQENDFEPSKTSNKLLKMLGINDPAELKKDKSSGVGQSMGAGGGDAGAFGPQDMSMVMATRNPEDGIEITDPRSIHPDWDHQPTDLIDASVLIWNMNTGREPFANGVPVGVGNALGFSETLEPSAQRFAQGIMQQIPPDFEAIDNARNFGELTPTWVEGGGSDPTPKADLLFSNPKTKEMIRTNVLVGKDQIFSNAPGESNALLNTLMRVGATDKFIAKKINSEVADNLRKDIGNVFNRLEQKSKVITESKDDILQYATEVYSEIIGTLEDIMSDDSDLKKAMIRETLTGEFKFGTESEAMATHVLATNKDGTDTQLQAINNGLVAKINEITDLYVSLSQPDIEERLENEETDGRRFIDYIRLMIQTVNESITTDKLTVVENDYSPGSNLGIDFGDDIGLDLDAKTNTVAQNNADNIQLLQQKQFVQAEIRDIVNSLTNIFDIMAFFNIQIESISIEPINFTTLNTIKTDLYNVVNVAGKRFRIPVDQSITEMMNDYRYIDNIFNSLLTEQSSTGPLVYEFKESSLHGTGSFASRGIAPNELVSLYYLNITESHPRFQRTDFCRLTNHSNKPNIDIREMNGNFYAIAKKPIAKGDEITIDYNTVYETIVPKIPGGEVITEVLRYTPGYDDMTIPPDDFSDLSDEISYLNNINEGRKVRKYKKGKGKCGTGSDPEWCYQKKKKKYRANLQNYNRKKGTHGNGDDKDASHKDGKIAGFEDESKNRSRNGKGSKKRKKIKEEYGAGEQGTWELLMKYLQDTPYASVSDYGQLDKKMKSNRNGLQWQKRK